MKFLIAIVQAYDSDRLLRALTDVGFRVTRINSVGGFLRMGNATVFAAVEESRVSEAIGIVRATCKPRVEVTVDDLVTELAEWFPSGVHEVPVGGGVVFTVPTCELVRIYPDMIERQASCVV